MWILESTEQQNVNLQFYLTWKNYLKVLLAVSFNNFVFCRRFGRHGGVQHYRQQRVWYSGGTRRPLGDTDHVRQLRIRGKELVYLLYKDSDLVDSVLLWVYEQKSTHSFYPWKIVELRMICCSLRLVCCRWWLTVGVWCTLWCFCWALWPSRWATVNDDYAALATSRKITSSLL